MRSDKKLESFANANDKYFMFGVNEGAVTVEMQTDYRTLVYMITQLPDKTLNTLENAIKDAKKANNLYKGPVRDMLREIERVLGPEKFEEMAAQLLKEGGQNE